MTKVIQIANVPDDVHDELEWRAAQAGLPLAEFLIREVERTSERPAKHAFLERLRNRPIRSVSPSPTETVRAERDRLSDDRP